MAKMGFAEAKKIRGESLSNRIANRLVGGESFGSSIGKSISEGTKARMTGLREKINPMNIVKFMTGGSNLAAALTGRITGASKEDMKYFTGKSGNTTSKDTASKIKPLMDQQEGMFDILEEIHKLLVDIREKRNADKPSEEIIAEKQREDERRHQDLINALLGKKVSNKNIPQNAPKGLFDNLFGGFSFRINPARATAKAAAKAGADAAAKETAKAGAEKATKETIKKSATKQLGKTIGKGALKSIPILGLAIGAGFAIGRLIEGDVVGAGIDVASGVGSALTSIPLTLTNAARDVYKDVYGNYPDPTNAKDQENLAEIFTVVKEVAAELLNNSAVPVDSAYQYDNLATDMQGTPTSSESSPETKSPTKMPASGGNQTPTNTASPTSSATQTPSTTNTASPTSSATQTPSTTNTASPMESTPSSAAVAAVTSQNLEMNLPTERNIGSNDLVNKTITNNTINSQNRVQQTQEVTMPSVRNSEETFKRMILYSTRVV